MTIIQNPILTGFNPDPSICRVGEDYYIAANGAHQWYYRDNNYGTDYYQSGGRHYYYDSIADSYYVKTS